MQSSPSPFGPALPGQPDTPLAIGPSAENDRSGNGECVECDDVGAICYQPPPPPSTARPCIITRCNPTPTLLRSSLSSAPPGFTNSSNLLLSLYLLVLFSLFSRVLSHTVAMASRKKVLLKVRSPQQLRHAIVCYGSLLTCRLPTLGDHSRRQRRRKDQFDEPICASSSLPTHSASARPQLPIFTALTYRSFGSLGQQEVQRKLQGHHRSRFPYQGSPRR